MSKKPKRRLNKTTRTLLIVIGVLLLLISAVQIYRIVSEEWQANNDNDDLTTIASGIPSEEDSIELEMDKEIKLTGKSFNELLDINSDFIGWLSFRSGLINQPVVQGENNDSYLHLSFFGKKSSIGTAFLDSAQNINMQNMTIYGHLVYRNESLMFSPLHKLVDQGNYDTNRYFSFSTATEVRNYEVAVVFYYDIRTSAEGGDADLIPYHYGTFSEAEFEQYIRLAKEKQFYETGVNISFDDKIITLQTCVRNEDNLRLIVIGKLISSEPIE